jgi:hypothetical protein
MAFTDTPNRYEAVFVQRRTDNSFYEQINVSGSDIIVYLDSTGMLNADKISVWAANYGLGSGGSSVSSSWASSSLSSSHAITASFALNGGGGGGGSGIFASQSLVATQSIYSTRSLQANQATQSLYATQSIYANQATQSLFSTQSIYANIATQSLFSTQSIYATSSLSSSWASASISSSYALYADTAGESLSASWASSSLTSSVTTTSSYAISASNAVTWDSSSLISYIEDLLQSTTYYLTSTASVNSFYEMRSTGSGVNTVTLTTSSIPDGGYVFAWITDPTEPHTTVLASGIYQPDFFASIDTPTGTTTLTPELYLTDASGNIYYELPAGGISNALTTTFTRYTLNIIVDFPTTMSITDRLLFRLKCHTTEPSKGFSVEVEGNVLSHLATPLAQILTNVVTASYAIVSATSVFAESSDSASWASSSISASYALNSSGGGPTVSCSWASSSLSCSLASTALVADYSLDSGFALSSSVAVASITADFALDSRMAVSASIATSASYLIGQSSTASYALTSSVAIMSISSSNAITASFALNAGGTASIATSSFTSSYVSSSGYADIINASYYRLGSKPYLVTSSYTSALTVTLAQNSNAYVKFTYHGVDTTYGTAFFMGEYLLQKDSIISPSGKQPGEIISQYNSNPTVNIQSYIPDIVYSTASGVLAIQLQATAGSFTGTLVYEIRGTFSNIEQPFIPPPTSSFGDTFETYPLGIIINLFASSSVFASPGSALPTVLGPIAMEGIDAYVSGSSPALNAGAGWVGNGIIN